MKVGARRFGGAAALLDLRARAVVLVRRLSTQKGSRVSLTLIPAAPPIRCDADRFLVKAEAALGRSQYIKAGRSLRKGVRRMLLALCAYHDVSLPGRPSRRTIGVMLDRLQGHIDAADAKAVADAVHVGNRATQLEFVPVDELRLAIFEMQWFYNATPFAKGGVA